MNILVTGANGQLGNEMRIISKKTSYNFLFTDVVEAEGVETTYSGAYPFTFRQLIRV